MTTASFIHVVIDALMVGVIFVVQFVAYPGFSYFSRSGLEKWHPVYVRNIGMIVLPLMLGQLCLGSFWLFSKPGPGSAVYLGGVCLLWVITFLIFVPLHRKIRLNIHQRADLILLVRYNWIRTLLWCFLLGWNLYFTFFAAPVIPSP